MSVFNVYRVVISRKGVEKQLVTSVEADRFEWRGVYHIEFLNDNKSFFGKVKSSSRVSALQLDALENYLIQTDDSVPAPVQGDENVQNA